MFACIHSQMWNHSFDSKFFSEASFGRAFRAADGVLLFYEELRGKERRQNEYQLLISSQGTNNISTLEIHLPISIGTNQLSPSVAS
jgi:hypothetical protein